ncbi:fungal-specific transcription factor domain-containing protein [Xylariaceae sp. FL0016]|nr:fungal-specific transcription factor domain-containing protein [Xylariaceae sp. FL0016]
MLLYTKLAPPKVPKRRSRAGCIYCKEKKKKCDENRPQCSRCAERGLDCAYEAVKPRQRKKKDPNAKFTSYDSPPHDDDDVIVEEFQWPDEVITGAFYGSNLLSPVNSQVDTASLLNVFTTESDYVLSPTSPGTFDHGTGSDANRNRDLVRRASAPGITYPARSLQPDLAMIAPCPVGSPTLEFCIPAFSEFSDRPNRRALVDHFCNTLSHLIVFREESGNPFQQLVLPLSHKSTPVMNAIYALASAHLEYRGVKNSEKSIHFHNQAIQGLARLIENGGKVHNKNELLAAIMLLVYYEVLVQRGRTNIVDGHLKGAFTIMCSSQDSSPASEFLERAFRFYDVITALSLGTPPLSTAPAAGCLLPFPPMDAPPASSFTNVDTLLGMATTLWPIMHRLSNLLSVKAELERASRTNQASKAAVLRTEFEATSQAIATALTQWSPCLPPGVIVRDDTVLAGTGTGAEIEFDEVLLPEHERSRLQSILHNALAYRHSALVYLHRTILGRPPHYGPVQRHARAALLHCVATTAHRGPMGALLWPLFVAACEAVGAEERRLAEEAFVEVELRQGMTNIEQAWRIIREVWNRLDCLESGGAGADGADTDLWRKVSAEMGVNIVFG